MEIKCEFLIFLLIFCFVSVEAKNVAKSPKKEVPYNCTFTYAVPLVDYQLRSIEYFSMHPNAYKVEAGFRIYDYPGSKESLLHLFISMSSSSLWFANTSRLKQKYSQSNDVFHNGEELVGEHWMLGCKKFHRLVVCEYYELFDNKIDMFSLTKTFSLRDIDVQRVSVPKEIVIKFARMIDTWKADGRQRCFRLW